MMSKFMQELFQPIKVKYKENNELNNIVKIHARTHSFEILRLGGY